MGLKFAKIILESPQGIQNNRLIDPMKCFEIECTETGKKFRASKQKKIKKEIKKRIFLD